MTAYLDALGLVCALGADAPSVAAALLAGDPGGLAPADGWVTGRRLTVGAVRTPLAPLPAPVADCDSRNNRLLLAAARQIEADIERARARYGAQRIGVVLGTSTSGIHEASQGIAEHTRNGHLPPAYRYAQQEMSAPAVFLSDWLGLGGPAYCLSTACTSGGRALLSAARLLRLGVCDAVLCGGVDSLCRLTLNGFAALEAVADERCLPFSANRRGINIGEGAALFLMTRERPAAGRPAIALLGAGASSDAYHISAPQPDGLGALEAMNRALASAGLAPAQIDYLNLHGTATPHNDAMESLAVRRLFRADLPCSSSKGQVGHTLGAAGALEAAFCWLTLSPCNPDGLLPPHLWDGQSDPALPPLALVAPGTRLPGRGGRRLMSNSFAFGGNNLSLIIGDA